jgi:hypothetical protein
MATYSKPCTRGGCTGTMYTKTRKQLAQQRFCGQRCAYLERVRLGTWCTHVLTPEEARRAGKKGGSLVGDKRHQQALIRWSAKAFAMLPRDIIDTLDRDQLLRLKVASGKIWHAGHEAGYAMRATRERRAKVAGRMAA